MNDELRDSTLLTRSPDESHGRSHQVVEENTPMGIHQNQYDDVSQVQLTPPPCGTTDQDDKTLRDAQSTSPPLITSNQYRGRWRDTDQPNKLTADEVRHLDNRKRLENLLRQERDLALNTSHYDAII